jgi:hypothetical protein
MDRIEFDASVDEGGVIRIPPEYGRTLTKGEKVHVSLSPKGSEKQTVKRMQENPLHAPGFKPLQRDELYDRNE